MTDVKNPFSSLMNSLPIQEVYISVQEDCVVEHSGIKCSFLGCQDFLNLTIRKCSPKRYYYSPARRLGAELKTEKQGIKTEIKQTPFLGRKRSYTNPGHLTDLVLCHS